MRLVVGLGNPGCEYENTRHNIGYMFLDYIVGNDKFSLNKKFNSLEYKTVIDGENVIFIKPLTFMNLSGEAVLKYVNYYKINVGDILVIQDDLDLNLGRYKLMLNRGDGGHNGIKNIVLNLQSKEFLRLKIGISKARNDTVDYVLGKFNDSEIKTLKKVFKDLSDIVNDYIETNTDILMGKYNIRIREDNKVRTKEG